MTRRRESPASPTVVVPAGAPVWVTADLLAQTLRVWQPYYGERLTEEDALEMLLHTAAFARMIADERLPRRLSAAEFLDSCGSSRIRR